MHFRLLHRRSPLHALTAWLCLALHLAVFTASGWHFHGPGEHRHDAGGMCVPVSNGDAGCSGHDGHAGTDNHGDENRPPRDGRDPDGCCLCKAILALHHAALAAPAAMVAVPADACAPLPVYRRSHAVAWQRHQWSRGPPTTGS